MYKESPRGVTTRSQSRVLEVSPRGVELGRSGAVADAEPREPGERRGGVRVTALPPAVLRAREDGRHARPLPRGFLAHRSAVPHHLEVLVRVPDEIKILLLLPRAGFVPARLPGGSSEMLLLLLLVEVLEVLRVQLPLDVRRVRRLDAVQAVPCLLYTSDAADE